MLKRKVTLNVYSKYNCIEDIYNEIKNYNGKYYDYTFNIKKYDDCNIYLEILQTSLYSKIDRYGVYGIISKNDEKFIYTIWEKTNILDYAFVAVIAWFLFLFIIVLCTGAIKEAAFFMFIIIFVVLIISSLFYMRRRILDNIYEFIRKKMK